MPLKTIDLCAGIGGIRRGFELAGGFENVISAEVDELACRTYEHLFKDNPRNDVTSEEFKDRLKSLHYDILLAGFPCQAFSSVGLKLGFEDTTKGTIFFDIARIVKGTIPKVVFLENVENLIIHDKGNTFKTIIRTLDEELDYEIIGYPHNDIENLKKYSRGFLRNSRDFGVPQNRPRVYIVAFSRAYFGSHIKLLPKALPLRRENAIFGTLEEVLEKDIEARYFLSKGYLETLENHIVRQKKNGNGFGYRIVNAPEIEHPIANTLLATGGSGKERNLIYDVVNGRKYAGTTVKGKYSEINHKNVRTMTPIEWGRLQGFISYGFKNDDGSEGFSFPQGIPITQQYKQFGNSVTIPVIEQMAIFIKKCIEDMREEFTAAECRLFSMYGKEFKTCRDIYKKLGGTIQYKTLQKYFDMVYHFGVEKEFGSQEVMQLLKCSSARAAQLLLQIQNAGCVSKIRNGRYMFK